MQGWGSGGNFTGWVVGAVVDRPLQSHGHCDITGKRHGTHICVPYKPADKFALPAKRQGWAIKFIAPQFYGKTKTRRPLPRLVFHKKKEKNRTSCRFLQRNGTHPSTSRCPSFRPGRALWYSSSLSNHGDVFCPRVIFRCLHSTRFLSELQEVAVYNVL